MRTSRLWLAKLGLLLFSLMIVALFGEVGLRLIKGPPVIWKYPQESYVRDPETGHRLAPSQIAFTHDKPLTTDEFGIRVSAATAAARSLVPTRRVLALGDSQTAGDGLVYEDGWPAQLERFLARSYPEESWKVYNAGVSGYAPWQYAVQLRRHAERLAIDDVVVAIYLNDVTPRPKNIDTYVVTNSTSRRILYLLKRSALFTTLWQSRFALEQKLSPDPNFGWELRILEGEQDEWVERAWDDFELGIREIQEICQLRELGLTIVILPYRDQVSGKVTGRAYNNRVAKLASDLDIPVVDMLEPLEQAFKEHGSALFIAWDGHNSSLANGVVGQEVARHFGKSGAEGVRFSGGYSNH